MSGRSLPDETSRLVSLETRVGAIEAGIEKIATKLDARSSINWAPYSLLATVIIAVVGMGFGWINSGMGRLESGIVEVKADNRNYVGRPDLDNRFAVAAQRRDDLQRLTDARIERSERDVDALQRSLVPRGEHDQIWAGQRGRDADLQRQIDENRKAVADLHTPRDAIQDMRRRIDQLETMRRPP